jgi:hypothetical protein
MKISVSMIAVFVITVICFSSISLAEKNQSNGELRKKYSRVNKFLNIKFPKSKAAPDYWK